MKMHVLSLAVGLFVGVIYGVLNVRSPAPPVIALVRLGILVGEQLVPLARRLISSELSAMLDADFAGADNQRSPESRHYRAGIRGIGRRVPPVAGKP